MQDFQESTRSVLLDSILKEAWTLSQTDDKTMSDKEI